MGTSPPAVATHATPETTCVASKASLGFSGNMLGLGISVQSAELTTARATVAG